MRKTVGRLLWKPLSFHITVTLLGSLVLMVPQPHWQQGYWLKQLGAATFSRRVSFMPSALASDICMHMWRTWSTPCQNLFSHPNCKSFIFDTETAAVWFFSPGALLMGVVGRDEWETGTVWRCKRVNNMFAKTGLLKALIDPNECMAIYCLRQNYKWFHIKKRIVRSSVRSLKGLKRNSSFATDDGHHTLHPVPITSVPFFGAVTEEQCLWPPSICFKWQLNAA